MMWMCDSDVIKPDAVVEASGLDCPLPILKARKALAGLSAGQVLQIISTDPQSVHDFHTFCHQLRHDLLDARDVAGKFYILLRKGEQPPHAHRSDQQ